MIAVRLSFARYTRRATTSTALLFTVLAGASACGDGGGGTTSAASSGSASNPSSSSAGTGGAGGSGTGGGSSNSGGGAGGSAGIGTGGSATGGGGGASTSVTAGTGGAPSCATPVECSAAWEQAASDKLDSLAPGPAAPLQAFLTAMPKGADLHNHLSGAVYAETVLGWAKADGDCVNSSSYSVVFASGCSASTQPTPTSGTFYDSIVRAWSMKDFVAGTESGHDHFFATFGKFGTVAGVHRDDSLADVVARAAAENQVHVETMFNLAKNVGNLATQIWSGTLTAQDLPGLHQNILASSSFASSLASDVAVVNSAKTNYRTVLGCDDLSPPLACDVDLRFIAQVARTGAKDLVFGQLVGAFEMAAKTDGIVALNLSSPEDDTTSLANYDLHMAMLDYLYNYYTVTQRSPLHVTLHAGELTAEYLPAQYKTANTFHIREAVELGHAERIGHGVDILSETDPSGLMAELKQKNVLVEVCLSSNAQILKVAGAAHPLSTYMANGVPVALATDDQGVSRSSLAGELLLGVTDQHLTYRQLKAMARNSLEHSFVPGRSLWDSIDAASAVADCAPTATMGLGDQPDDTCQGFLAVSQKANLQWSLERRFAAFERQQ